MQLVRSGSDITVLSPSGPIALGQIIGIGLNYAQHAIEQGSPIPERPVVFSKNTMAACLSGESIRVPKICQDKPQVDFEGELAVYIGRPARDVPIERALEYVLGYSCANDVSARWWQKQGSGGQFYRGKSFDTFCPLGPAVIPAGQVSDPNNLRLITRVNGQVMQDSTTGDMIFPVKAVIAELSRGMTLMPGTVILTGTPPGVGMARTPQVFLASGDTVEVEIEQVGVLVSTVMFE
ncbi:MAG: fumarylacetoacetate hydrolase family protein [Pyrinomonadaceae bacterium]|nr:fumarylacetoacetate hydrolase family protein [Phycisphaerales bacterium]